MSNSSVHVDSTGNSVAFWLKGISGIAVLQAKTTSSFPGTWSAVSTISNPAVSASLPCLGCNDLGDSVLVWATTVSPGLTNNFVSVRPISTGIWSAATQFSNAGSIQSFPKISINEAGQILAQWTAYTDGTQTASAIYIATSTVASGVWSAVQQISP